MHKEILTLEQLELTPLLKKFSKDFYLVGGTAIAFHIGHRRSIDFDLFTAKEFNNITIRKKLPKGIKIERVFKDETGNYTISINGVRCTFFHYPFLIHISKSLNDAIKLPNLLTLAAMKAYALGRRAKWKDYVDLYFIMKDYYTLGHIVEKAKRVFGNEFNEKIFRAQLAYFKDIDYSEKVIYLPGFETKDALIKKKLTEFSVAER